MSHGLFKLEERAHAALRARADRKRAIAPHLLTGERGEDAAFFHLRGLGYTIVARRWRSERQAGDLDLVAWDGDTLVIFEVKARTARDLYPAEVQVDPHKQTILRRMAHAFLLQMPAPRHDGVPQPPQMKVGRILSALAGQQMRWKSALVIGVRPQRLVDALLQRQR